MASRQIAPIVKAHAPSEGDIVSPIPSVTSQVNVVVGTDNCCQLEKFIKSLREDARPHMTQDVANAPLIPNSLKTANEESVNVLVMKM